MFSKLQLWQVNRKLKAAEDRCENLLSLMFLRQTTICRIVDVLNQLEKRENIWSRHRGLRERLDFIIKLDTESGKPFLENLERIEGAYDNSLDD